MNYKFILLFNFINFTNFLLYKLTKSLNLFNLQKVQFHRRFAPEHTN